MPIIQQSGRQNVQTALLTINFGDPTAYGTAENAIELPPGSIVVGGDIVVDTPFNSTTNSLTLGDATTANRYANAVDLKTAARSALTVTGFVTTTAERFIRANLAQTGGVPTAGSVRIRVDYVTQGRAKSVWGAGR
ncbi:hypothetical protein PSQ40_04920 [Curvibacter sp. HBC61]|uniref:Uncharacterized protein n=1 Tax=Curvibacter cyanobacteriorum TaxID=3026422 RepID=A0ABT5MYR2_9BURK|nr:hypothetical protein [Curvibacter sp. HBC61]MDD0837908.1 hypothetical protein [Curvibacter sp. HBC61]